LPAVLLFITGVLTGVIVGFILSKMLVALGQQVPRNTPRSDGTTFESLVTSRVLFDYLVEVINLFQFIKFYLLGYFSALRPAAVPASLAAARVAAFWALR
jgi:hypothetical protein